MAEAVREKERNLTTCRNELNEATNKISQLTAKILEVQRKIDALKLEVQNYEGVTF